MLSMAVISHAYSCIQAAISCHPTPQYSSLEHDNLRQKDDTEPTSVSIHYRIAKHFLIGSDVVSTEGNFMYGTIILCQKPTQGLENHRP